MESKLNPLFSISMVNYNKGKYIQQAIDSVINQTYNNWELIIIDDGSTDESINILSNINDPRIKVVFLGMNKGVSSAHKDAFDFANGELIGILDSDDCLIPTAIEKMVVLANNNPDCGFLYSNYAHCDEDLSQIKEGPNHFPIVGGSIIHDRNAVSHFKVFVKEVYEQSAKFEVEMKRAVDRDITLKMEEVTDFAFLNEVLYLYRYTKTGISTRIAGNAEEAKRYFEIAIFNAKRRRVH